MGRTMARSTKKTSTTTRARSTKASTAKPKLAVVAHDPVAVEAEALEPVAVMAEEAHLAGKEEKASESPVVLVKKKDFVERVVAVSGAKKAVARGMTEAVLRVLGEALSQGESLILPPLGKLRVAKHIDKTGAEVLQIKLKRSLAAPGAKKAEKTAQDPLAEAED